MELCSSRSRASCRHVLQWRIRSASGWMSFPLAVHALYGVPVSRQSKYLREDMLDLHIPRRSGDSYGLGSSAGSKGECLVNI